MKLPIIFTDLDGTLLDYSSYSFDKALPAIELLRQKNIPLIICSSKTQREIEYYRKKLGNNHPFISENGGGIFIPKSFSLSGGVASGAPVTEEGQYRIIRLGARYSDLRRTIEALRSEGFDVRGFGDMTARELMVIADMKPEEAEMAKERAFDEPFIFNGNKTETMRLFSAIISKGYNVTKGRFFHIIGNSDKGKAVSILTDLYRKKLDEILTVAIGDSPNDIPMLEKADYPIIVQKPDKTYDQTINLPNLVMAEGVGPDGWNNAVLKLLRDVG